MSGYAKDAMEIFLFIAVITLSLVFERIDRMIPDGPKPVNDFSVRSKAPTFVGAFDAIHIPVWWLLQRHRIA